MVSRTKIRMGVATTTIPKWVSVGQQKIRKPGLHYCRMAECAAEEHLQFFIFAPKDVNWKEHTVHAWVPREMHHPHLEWVWREVNLPDVIYENIFVHLAIQGYSRVLRQMAKVHGIPLFNPPLPGKWSMAKRLEKSALASYQPETELLRGTVTEMRKIREWGTAYVKPVGGYGGMGVTRVEYLGNGYYRVATDRTRSRIVTQRLDIMESDLLRFLYRKAKVPHLLQRGLQLLTLSGRRLDFRTVVQRDKRGVWKLVGIVPKMAAKDGVVTNIVAGGERLSMMMLHEMANREGKKIPVTELERCSLQIANLISQRHPFAGIIGFDLGVEEDTQVKMIEMNPKPARSLLNDAMRQHSAQLAAEFAVYLGRRRHRMRLISDKKAHEVDLHLALDPPEYREEDWWMGQEEVQSIWNTEQ